MSEHIYLLTLTIPLGTVLVIFAMKYLSAAYKARAETASAKAYQELAAKCAAAQSDNAAALAAIQASLADMKGRLAGVEKVLKEVE
ncbi:MAG: hypothetical protein K0R43_3231 [Pseudoduganella sp.]|jgi:hypothetical protein|nr:hypothetical protein [Pseudoduganella sp.]